MTVYSDLKSAFANLAPDVGLDQNERDIAYLKTSMDIVTGETTGDEIEVPNIEIGTVQNIPRVPLWLVVDSSLKTDLAGAGFVCGDLSEYTDLDENVPSPNADVEIGAATTEGNALEGTDCAIINVAGTYQLTWAAHANADTADEDTDVSLLAYPVLSEDSHGPLYDLALRDTHTCGPESTPTAIYHVTGSAILWLPVGAELNIGVEYDGASEDPDTFYALMSLIRLF